MGCVGLLCEEKCVLGVWDVCGMCVECVWDVCGMCVWDVCGVCEE